MITINFKTADRQQLQRLLWCDGEQCVNELQIEVYDILGGCMRHDISLVVRDVFMVCGLLGDGTDFTT